MSLNKGRLDLWLALNIHKTLGTLRNFYSYSWMLYPQVNLFIFRKLPQHVPHVMLIHRKLTVRRTHL
ncbi:unnamed protein product [Allacma fusca]|uniref:Uncharacterized protein n=1 Tax=Allacma fusca TaxID=39272 RepID=A0A8J2PDV0_9HEXA|nr:unnamed protein product [Allacma fusca]